MHKKRFNDIRNRICENLGLEIESIPNPYIPTIRNEYTVYLNNNEKTFIKIEAVNGFLQKIIQIHWDKSIPMKYWGHKPLPVMVARAFMQNWRGYKINNQKVNLIEDIFDIKIKIVEKQSKWGK